MPASVGPKPAWLFGFELSLLGQGFMARMRLCHPFAVVTIIVSIDLATRAYISMGGQDGVIVDTVHHWHANHDGRPACGCGLTQDSGAPKREVRRVGTEVVGIGRRRHAKCQVKMITRRGLGSTYMSGSV